MPERRPTGRPVRFGPHLRRMLGMGPAIFAPPLLLGIAGVVLTLLYPATFTLWFLPPLLCWILGGVLFVAGQVLWIAAVPQVRRAIRSGRLVTGGAYRHCRHPVYAGWLLLAIPGAGLLFYSWLVLLAAPLAWLTYALFIGREERALGEQFGEAHEAYRAGTPSLIPRRPRQGGGAADGP